MNTRYKLVLSVIVFTAYSSFAQEDSSPPPPGVGVIVAQPQSLTATENLPARLEASREAVIQPQVGGIVLKRLFTEGAKVKANQPLYQIDDAFYQANLISAKAKLAQAQANKALAQSIAARYAPLVREKAVSRQTYDQSLAEVKVAEASIMTAQAMIKQAEINLEYTKVKAPISGIIGRSNVSEGALVSPGSVEMATILQIDPMYVNISQSAADFMQMKKEFFNNDFHEGEIKINISLDDGTVYPYEGHLLFTDQMVDASTGELLVRAEIPNPEGLLLPGLYVRVDLPRRQYKNAYLIPQGAIARGRTNTVNIVAEDGSFTSREVEVVGQYQDSWIVTQGIQPGEMVMVESLSQLMGGATHVTPLILNDQEYPEQEKLNKNLPQNKHAETTKSSDSAQMQ